MQSSKFIRIEGGRVVYDSQMEIFIPKNAIKLRYSKERYAEKMKVMYDKRRSNIHILSKYLELISKDKELAEEFSTDYFSMMRKDFIRKWKNELKNILNLPISKAKFDEIFSILTEEQKKIIEDKKSNTIFIFAGPGTGKTKVLIDKIIYMILNENYKPHHFLMLSFSNSAVQNFRKRIFEHIGNMAYDMDIFTFHGLAIELLGESYKSSNQDQNLDKTIIRITKKLESGEISPENTEFPFKRVIVLDEFQDAGEEQFNFVSALYKFYSDETQSPRLIAVGDDDQAIMESVNGTSMRLFKKFIDKFQSKNDDKIRSKYFLTTNFRSCDKIVNFSNIFLENIKFRIAPDKTMNTAKLHNFLSGKIEIIKYDSKNFIPAVYDKVSLSSKSNPTSTIAILTFKNDDVLSISSYFKEKNPDIKIDILTRSRGVNLHLLEEIFFFTKYLESNLSDEEEKIITDRLFQLGIENIKSEFEPSSSLNLVIKHIEDFKNSRELSTLSMWQSYIHECGVGELSSVSSSLVVSTIHRSKGLEFDEVHIVLPKLHDQGNMDYFYRQYYVAMTRAKQKLIIHTEPDEPFMKYRSLKFVEFDHDHTKYLSPK
jgi:ATP-dependent DNA helicase RecQ